MSTNDELKNETANGTKPVLGDSGCYGCKHFDTCGIRLDYGNDGCDDKEV
jgi:hypothetical protein